MPEEHDGSSAVTFTVAFSEEPHELGFRTMRDQIVRVEQGGATITPTKAKRAETGSNRRWNVTVEPASKADLNVSIAATTDCEADDAVCTADGRKLSNAIAATILGPPGLSVADTRVYEAPGATLDFAVTMGRASSSTVTVDYATADGTATAGEDYTAASGTLTFEPGEIAKAVSVEVIDDGHDEGEETLTLTLSNPSGGNAWLADAEAIGVIENTDAMPKAWLARFGRTVAEQVIEAAEGRFAASRNPGVEVNLAGQPLGGGSVEEIEALEDKARRDALARWLREGEEKGDGDLNNSSTLTGREVLAGTSFALTSGTPEGGFGAVWGHGATSRFDGREGDLTLEGEVESAMLGADFTRDVTTVGLMLALSRGEGTYRGEGEGEVESSLTGLYPYARVALNDRVTLWGVAGYGEGTLKLTPKDAATLETDMDLMMGAVGVRGVALEAPDEGGFELSVTSDAMAVRTSSDATSASEGGNLASASANVTRLRLGLEGAWRGWATQGGATLTPMVEIGVRHDAGDAETGFGTDIGAALAWADPGLGLMGEIRARGLLTHEAGGFRDRGVAGSLAWDPRPESSRGFSLSARQTMGASASGGMDALLGRGTLEGLAANDNGDELQQRSLELKMGYGFAVFGNRFTGTPEVGLRLSNGHREMSLGWRLALERGGPVSMELGLEATRREAANDDEEPVNALMLHTQIRW